MTELNLYVHIPFCLSKCAYCALYSVAPPPRDAADFPALAAREYSLRAAPAAAATVYFGGGTPGVLGPAGIEALAAALASAGADLSHASEWTVELNPSPEVTTDALLAALRRMGATRLSFGFQSFDDSVLRALGRRHTAADAKDAVARARRAGFDDVGFDLIAGLPGVDAPGWDRALAAAVALAPTHISVYGLIVEPGTPLARDVAAGRIHLPGDDAQMDALARTEERLAAEGFRRYEISNYALPGHECRHNLACWRGDDYLGIGPAAASRLGRHRRTNARDYAGWRAALADHRLPPAENDEERTAGDDAEERFLFGLRLAEGVAPEDFARRHPAAAPLLDGWLRGLARLAAGGFAEKTPAGRWTLTRRGREVADAALEELVS